MPQLWQSGLFENLEPYAKGPNGTNLDDFLPGQTQATLTTSASPPPRSSSAFFRSTPILYYNAEMLQGKGGRCRRRGTSYDAAGKSPCARAPRSRPTSRCPSTGGSGTRDHEAGGSLFPPDGKKAAFREKGAEALQFWVDLVNRMISKGRPARTTMPGKSPTPTFWSQRAMIYTSTASRTMQTENMKLVRHRLPPRQGQAGGADRRHFFVARDAPASEEAGWAFIKWMTDPAQTISLSKATGYMPIRTSAVNSPEMQDFYKQNPNYKTAIDLKTARFPFSPGLIEIQREVIQPNLEAAVLGIKTSAEIMQAAEAKANEILSK